MISRLPSVAKPYDAVWSLDPAFEQLPDGADDATRTEHAHRWKVARETGDYSKLLVAGASPTKFVMRQLPPEHFPVLVDMMRSGSGNAEVASLSFRLALQSISNWDGVELKHEIHAKFGLIASLGFLAEAGLTAGQSMGLTTELGGVAFEKAMALRPL